MNGITNDYAQAGAYASGTGRTQSTSVFGRADSNDKTADSLLQADKTQEADKVSVSGRTYGNAKLSKNAAEYYEKLKKKYGNAEFVLVDSDKVDEAKNKLGSFANNSSMVVLIDTDKVERMAEDEEYREKYESILDNATSQISQIVSNLQSQYGSSANKIKTVGMTVDDGGNASFFAVVDKSLKLQRERIEKKREEKAEAADKAEKEEAARKIEERLEERRAANKTGKTGDKDDAYFSRDYDIITADSAASLYDKLSAILYDDATNSVMSEEEKYVGQSVDYSA